MRSIQIETKYFWSMIEMKCTACGMLCERKSNNQKFCAMCRKVMKNKQTKQWRKDNPERVYQLRKDWDARNHDKVIENGRRWKRNNPEKHRAGSKRWAKNNPDKVNGYRCKRRELKGDEVRAYARDWSKTKKGKKSQANKRKTESYKNAQRKHRQQKRTAGEFPTALWNAKLESLGHKCVKCGSDEVTVDHIVPVSKGGTNHIDNLQPLCRPCNSGKKDRLD